MSETDRARERLDFEAAAEAIEKGKWNTKTDLTLTQQHMKFPGAGDGRFVPSTGVEVINPLSFLLVLYMLYSSFITFELRQ